jgi:F-type H+-transporting ATPase subunit epsilon
VSDEARDLLHLELVAPRGPVFDGDVRQVILPGAGGEMGILPRHAPLVTQLAIGRLRVQMSDGEWSDFAVAEGFAKVQSDKVIVLADSAQESSEIDVARVRQSIDQSVKRLEMYRTGTVPEGEDVDPYREQLALKRAQNRLKVAGQTEE